MLDGVCPKFDEKRTFFRGLCIGQEWVEHKVWHFEKFSGSNLFCGWVANHPRMGHECPNLRPPNSFIREKFVDGLGMDSKTTKSVRIRKFWGANTVIN